MNKNIIVKVDFDKSTFFVEDINIAMKKLMDTFNIRYIPDKKDGLIDLMEVQDLSLYAYDILEHIPLEIAKKYYMIEDLYFTVQVIKSYGKDNVLLKAYDYIRKSIWR